MKINPVSNKVFINNDKPVKATKTENNQPKDKIEISNLAKSMSSASQEKIQSIREKIDAGFYNSDKVIAKVAEEILKEISGE